jgi:hypothetical protein
MVVVIPAGPKDDPADTIHSVFRYSSPELIVAIDDTHGRGIGVTHPKMAVIPAVARGGWGGLWVNLAAGFRFAVEHADFDVLLRLDTDALLLGPGLAEAAMERFEKNPEIGALGSYRIGPDGVLRDWSSAWKRLRNEAGPLGFRHPACRRTLRRLIAAAPAYIRGEHALGSSVLYREKTVREMYRRGILDLPELASSLLGEDQIFGLLTVVAGYRTGDFGGPEDPMAVRWKGLPAAPEDLLRAGKLVTHSVRSWEGMTEVEIRKYFASARG